MQILENIVLALYGLLANKMRSLLTMLGIIIGIGSVIGIMTVGNSLTASVTSNMQSMGANNITVYVTQKSDSDTTEGGTTRMFRSKTIDHEDLITDEMVSDFRKAYVDDLYAISLSTSLGQYTVEVNGNSAPVNASGNNNDVMKESDLTITGGRFLSDEDQELGRKVAVVSDVFANELFPGQDAIGQSFEITIESRVHKFYVVGVYEYADNGMSFAATDELATTSLYVPLKTAQNILGQTGVYQSITVMGNTGVDSNVLMANAQAFLGTYYTRNPGYTIATSSMQSLMDSLTTMMGTMSLAISVIAGISLLVGGIGVMNIMLVSITERTREIGTRKALGAPNSSIRIQFIVESVIICLIGGIIGIIVGLALGAAGAQLLGYPAAPSISTIIFAVLFSMAIGVFFGYYPANKAAKMDPIEALRYE